MSVYWLYGNPGVGKRVLAKKVHNLISDSSRNWRRSTLIFDESDFRTIHKITGHSEVSHNELTSLIQNFVELINLDEIDIVISSTNPNTQVREHFKESLGDDLIGILVKSSKIDPLDIFNNSGHHDIIVDTSKYKIERIFSKLVNDLDQLDKI